VLTIENTIGQQDYPQHNWGAEMKETTVRKLQDESNHIHRIAGFTKHTLLLAGSTLLSMLLPLQVVAGEVVVKPGETLAEIAERYGTSVQRLMQLNNLLSPQDLWAGSRIQVPDRNGGGGARTTSVNADNGRTVPDRKQGQENNGGGTSTPTTKANASQPVKANETASNLGGVSSEVHERCKALSTMRGA
jgi:LysM repeat protein